MKNLVRLGLYSIVVNSAKVTLLKSFVPFGWGLGQGDNIERSQYLLFEC